MENLLEIHIYTIYYKTNENNQKLPAFIDGKFYGRFLLRAYVSQVAIW